MDLSMTKLLSRARPLLLGLPLLFLAPGCQEMDGPPGYGSGYKAAEITGTDVLTGAPIKLSEFQTKGTVVLLDFWATWCPPCVAAIPHERELARRFDGRPFVIIGISKDSEKQELVDFLNREKLPWANMMDTNGTISSQWGVNSIPTFILIDANGVIVKRWVGAGEMSQIRSAIEEAVQAAEKRGG